LREYFWQQLMPKTSFSGGQFSSMPFFITLLLAIQRRAWTARYYPLFLCSL